MMRSTVLAVLSLVSGCIVKEPFVRDDWKSEDGLQVKRVAVMVQDKGCRTTVRLTR